MICYSVGRNSYKGRKIDLEDSPTSKALDGLKVGRRAGPGLKRAMAIRALGIVRGPRAGSHPEDGGRGRGQKL